jgi:hypothetical protein
MKIGKLFPGGLIILSGVLVRLVSLAILGLGRAARINVSAGWF